MALHGVEVVGACDLTEAASIWCRDRYDAVLIDIRRTTTAWRDEIKKEKPQLAGSYVAKEKAAQRQIPGTKQSGKAAPPYRSVSTGGYETQNRSLCVPPSNPFVERLIGTVRREFLDRTLFWATADLETKLLDVQHYYNEHRTHAGLDGRPPEPSLKAARLPATFRSYRWQRHCHGLYQTPIAA